MELDQFARYLMREAPKYLNESGYFQMLCEWVEIEGTPWAARLSLWAEGLGCDVWVLKLYTTTPIAYGKHRCEQRPGSRESADAAFGDWVDYYRTNRVHLVHGGLITLRRRAGKNWIRLDEDPTLTLANPVGPILLDGFAAQDLIVSTDEVLLSTRLVLLDRARLRQLLHRDGARWTPTELTLTVPGAFNRELELAPLVAEFTGQFDGAQTLGEMIDDLARRVDAPREKVASECLGITRKLLERGFLAAR